jgi:hypothetical protein
MGDAMSLVESRGDQDPHGLTEQFLAVVAEKLFDLRVYLCNSPFVVGNDDGVRRGLEKRFKQRCKSPASLG